MREITDIEELRLVLHEAANDNHRNAENYQFEKMKKRLLLIFCKQKVNDRDIRSSNIRKLAICFELIWFP